MIHIQKMQEPQSLTEYKKQAHAYYGGCNKADIRKNLLQEQGHLCAYCMRRIYDDEMKIEHWKPREGVDDSPQALDYRNTLGVCMGHIASDEAVREKNQGDTCDSSKGDETIDVNPLDASTLSTIYYKSSTGEIHATDSKVEKDLTVTLNLNSVKHQLPQNRRSTLNAAINEATRLFSGNQKWTRSNLEKIIRKYSETNKDGKKMEYAGIVLWYMNKKLRK